MASQYKIHFTSLDGSKAEITGDLNALDAIERAFDRAGIRFNTQVKTWDERYYNNVPRIAAHTR